MGPILLLIEWIWLSLLTEKSQEQSASNQKLWNRNEWLFQGKRELGSDTEGELFKFKWTIC